MRSSLLYIALLTLSIGTLYVVFDEPTNDFKRGFSLDFMDYLDQNYRLYEFHRPNIRNAAYGGADIRPTSQPSRIPIVFIHGNSDIGVGDGTESSSMTGWSEMIKYLQQQGYERKDLYVTTWGTGKSTDAALNYHSEAYLKYLRTFLEAVLNYTQAAQVNVIGHSMGVTLARKIIKGGYGNDEMGSGKYYLGEPLSVRIKVFVGLAGANLGLSSCYSSGTLLPTCGMTNGFYPGLPPTVARSNFLVELDNNSAKEGTWIVTARSNYDEIIGGGCLVYGKYTTRIPKQDQEIVFNSAKVGHFGVRDDSGAQVYQILVDRGATLSN